LCAQSIVLSLAGEGAEQFRSIGKIQQQYPSIVEAESALQDGLQKLYAEGYLAASVDSFGFDESSAFAKTHLGKAYKWASIKNTNIPQTILDQSGYDQKRFIDEPISPPTLGRFLEKVIRYYENNGYPFASVQLDSLAFKAEGVRANLLLREGPLVKIDTIILNKEANISKNYLRRYLGVSEGDIYDERKIKAMSQRIQEVSFLEEAYPWRMNFNISQTSLNWYVKDRSANRADVLIGLLPSNQEIGNKFLLTGDIKLAFLNALGQGERLEINWQNLQFQSPRMTALAAYPYIFNTQIGLSASFDYYKKDTTFRTVNGELGFIYEFNANNQIKAYYQTGSSRLLSINIPRLIANRALPENADIRNRSFGLETKFNKVDYLLSPRKGYQALVDLSATFRNVLRNTIVEETYDPVRAENFSYLYDTMEANTFRWQIKANAAYYVPLGKRLVLASKYHGAIMFSKNELYRNEVFQIGGFRLLRGFDEGSLFVNQYHIGTIEPRYLISQNSYFFTFADFGFLESEYPGLSRQTNPYGFGLGMVFETKSGLFNINYAVGATSDTDLRFRNSKIHFGYVNYF